MFHLREIIQGSGGGEEATFPHVGVDAPEEVVERGKTGPGAFLDQAFRGVPA
jgi:hypothetical protein